MNAFGDDYLGAAAPGQVDQGLAFTQVLGAAGDMHGNRFCLWGELQFVEQVAADETHRVVQVQAAVAQVLDQAQGARAGVAVDGVEAAAAGVEQGADQFLALVFGLLGVALGREGLATAQAFLMIREDDLVAGLFQQAPGFLQQRHLLVITRCRAHDP
ncbi:hypothetical protein D9M71_378530 [compost metagenome]